VPRRIAADAGLAEGVAVTLRVEGQNLIVTRARPRYRLIDLLAKMHPQFRHKEVDWGPPRGKEVW
jgi:antitoxin MazE